MKKNVFEYKNYFFDFDGVIVDSLGIKSDAFGFLFEEYGSEIVEKVKKYHLDNGGVSRYEKFRHYYENLLNKPITQEIISELDRKFSEKVIEEVVKAKETPGIKNFLEELGKRNKTSFVVSATPQEEIREIVSRKGLKDKFKKVVGSPLSKTKNLTELLKDYSLDAYESVFFGDAKSDYKAAADNDVDFIAISIWSDELSSISDLLSINDFTVLLKD